MHRQDELFAMPLITRVVRPPVVERGDERALHPAALPRLVVVVVEDDEEVREAMCGLVAGWGHDVRGAGDGESAVEEILRRIPDIAFVDLGLPGIDGREVARRIRAELGERAPRLVALSGFGGTGAGAQPPCGFESHLVKPASVTAIDRELACVSRGAP